ncbi:MAG: glycine zipper domain-containing protein [Prosthecobacter sp.]
MKTLTLWALLISAPLVSCTNGPNARTGTVVGGLGGAAVGGIVGNQSGRGLEGALVGGGLGALAGNVIGGSQDQRNNDYYRRNSRYDDRRYYRR